jgi:hypothetical protein
MKKNISILFTLCIIFANNQVFTGQGDAAISHPTASIFTRFITPVCKRLSYLATSMKKLASTSTQLEEPATQELCRTRNLFCRLKNLITSTGNTVATYIYPRQPEQCVDLSSDQNVQSDPRVYYGTDLATELQNKLLAALCFGLSKNMYMEKYLARIQTEVAQRKLQQNPIDLEIHAAGLTSLPKTIKQLNVKKLSLRYTYLSPEAIKNICSWLPNLEELNLYGNHITELPYEIQQLHQLKLLNLCGNKLNPERHDTIKQWLPHTEIQF